MAPWRGSNSSRAACPAPSPQPWPSPAPLSRRRSATSPGTWVKLRIRSSARPWRVWAGRSRGCAATRILPNSPKIRPSLPGGTMRKIWIVAALLALLVPASVMAADTDQIYPDDMYLGKADAKVTVIEYASLSCPHCANFNKDVLPKIKAEYIDKGLVRWVFRDYPLNRPAFQAAILAHCGSPMRYFGLVDTLFQSQDY